MSNHKSFSSIKERIAFFEKLGAAKKDAEKKPSDKPNETKSKCPSCKLAYLKVIQNAVQTNVTGNKNWACVKKDTDDVIVQATTIPNTEDCWKKINWSGDCGDAVSGKPNQRKLSRAAAKHYHVEAELGGVKDHVDVWVLWATVTILTTGTTPANAPQTGATADGTENLGAQVYEDGKKAAGKIIAEAKISPEGVHEVVKTGWDIKRNCWGHMWKDGSKYREGNTPDDFWNSTWVDDTSYSSWKMTIPDADDKIYDNDAPTLGASQSPNNQETYINFKQWVEWQGKECSENAEWYWKARWLKTANPRIVLKEVGTGNIALPDSPHYPPP